MRFAGDHLLAVCRPRGLRIGNLTSQFWFNCYLHPFDQFATREPGWSAYLRYVWDFALFSSDKRELWAWKAAIIERLVGLRLIIHESRAQALPVDAGIPWLDFVVFRNHRLKARKVRSTHRRLRARLMAYHEGIKYRELNASIRGWINQSLTRIAGACAGTSWRRRSRQTQYAKAEIDEPEGRDEPGSRGERAPSR